MSDYDDTNRGVAFPPFADQSLILSGKLNVEGQEGRVALIKTKTASGKQLVEVYVKAGVLFPSDGENANAPDYSGPVDVSMATRPMRLAGWKKMKDGKPYMSLSISEPRTQSGGRAADDLDKDDIPF